MKPAIGGDGSRSGETISGLAGQIGEVARKAKEEAGTAAKAEKITIEHPTQEASSAAEGAQQEQKPARRANLTSTHGKKKGTPDSYRRHMPARGGLLGAALGFLGAFYGID